MPLKRLRDLKKNNINLYSGEIDLEHIRILTPRYCFIPPDC